MSLDIAHFAVGAGCTALVVTFLVPRVRYPRSLILVGGGWAMVPDVHWVSPVARTSLRQFHASPLADVFWFHRTLDTLDPTDSKAVAAVLLAFFLLANLYAEHRSYRAPDRVREVVDDAIDGWTAD